MKIFSIIFSCFFSVASTAQNELKVPATLKKVTVFQNRAQLNSELKTTVAQGITKIRITNIANTIEPSSIQVSGKGEIMILGVKFQTDLMQSVKNAPLQDTLELKTLEKQNQEVLLNVASNEELMMLANMNIKNDKDGILPEDLKDMLDFFNQKLTEIGQRKLKLKRSITKLDKEISIIALEIENQNASIVGIPEIIVSVSANTAAAVLLDINYIADGAGWSPIYDIRANGTKNPITLAYKANVHQETGLDWKNVNLVLSTANPAQSGDKPKQYPEVLSVFEPTMPQAKKLSKSSKNEESMAVEAFALESDAIALSEVVEVSENTTSASFEVKIPYSIPKNGVPELIDVQNLTIPAKFELSAVPKYDKDAFLVSKIGNWGKYNLINGKANIYLDGSFVGETFVQNNAIEDSLIISMGRDKKILINREELSEMKTQKVVGSNIKQTKAFKITVKNTKSEGVNLVLEDQIPISQDSRIEVESEELSSGVLESETGKLVWNLKLNPNESKEIIVKYVVKYPKGKIIKNL